MKKNESNVKRRLVVGSPVGSLGGRLPKWRGKVEGMVLWLVVAAASALAFTVIPVLATTISGPETTKQSIAADEDLEITSTGSVTVTDATDAIAIEFDADYAATFDNQGSVSATMTAGDGSSNATAANFLGDILGGDIFNTGTITATATGAADATGDAPAEAYGVYVYGDLTGGASLANDGPITATATGGSATAGAGVNRDVSASASGIYIYEDIENLSSLTGTGEITVSATGGSATVGDNGAAYAYTDDTFGIHADNVTNNSTFNYNGAISVTAQGGTAIAGNNGYATADTYDTAGIEVYNINNASSFVNAGAITVSATGGTATTGDDGYADADTYDTHGIYVDYVQNGSSFENSGAIDVQAKGGTATAGDTTAGGWTYTYAEADTDDTIGIRTYDIENGSSFVNTGGITVAARGGAATVGNATGGASWAYADTNDTFGIETDYIEDGSSFANSGAIDVVAQGGTATGGNATAGASWAHVIAYADTDDTAGIYIDDIEGGSSMTNTGDITVSAQGGTATVGNATGGASWAYAAAYADADDTYGIEIDDVDEGSSIENSGAINVVARGGTATAGNATTGNSEVYADAGVGDTAGIHVYDLEEGSSLTNSGAITVAAYAGTATVGDAVGYAAADASTDDTYGIEIDDDIDEGSSLDNSGNITVLAQAGTATAGDGGNAYADANDTAGIFIDSDVEEGSSLINSGAISVTAIGGTAIVQGNGSAYADVEDTYGIVIENDLEDGSRFENSGDIVVSAAAGSATAGDNGSAYAYTDDTFGISFDSDIEYGSTAVNTGNITVTATGGTALAGIGGYAQADVDETMGIHVDNDIEYGSSLENSGNIIVSATAGEATTGDNGSSYADTEETAGIFVDYDIDEGSSLDNSGNIAVTAVAGVATTGDNGSAYADAEDTFGIYVGEYVDEGSSLTNSGMITVNARGGTAGSGVSGYADAGVDTAAGLYVAGIDYGSVVTNTGEISVNAQAGQAEAGDNGEAYANASDVYGIGIDGGIGSGSAFDNSANVTVTATGGTATAGIGGTAEAYAGAVGVFTGGTVEIDSTLTNSGDLTVTATGGRAIDGSGYDMAYAEAYGIYTDTLVGELANSGSINATALAHNPGAEAEAYAYGMYVNNLDAVGVLNNSGSVNAVAEAGAATSETATAYGLYVSTLDGAVNNSGSISGSSNLPEDGYSLFVDDPLSSGTVNNLAGGVLSGNLFVGGTVEVNNSGTIEIPAMAVGNNAWIAGNYNQDANGVLSVGADDTDTYGRLAVDGTAAFADGAYLHVALVHGNTLIDGDELRDVVVAGTLDVTTLNIIDNSALLSFDYLIDGETVDLTMNQELAAPMVAAAGFSSAGGAAGVLDRMLAVYATPDAYADMDGVLADLRALETEGEVARAIVTTMPSLNLELSRLTLGNLHNILRLTRERQAAVRGQSSGDSAGGSGNLWVKGFGSWADQKNNNGAFGYDADTYGIVLGGDRDLGTRASIGLGLGYSASDVDGDSISTQSADVNSYQVFLYGDYRLEKQVDLSWHLGYGRHDNEVTRYVPLAGSFAGADFDSWSMNAGVAASRDYKKSEKTTLTPSVRLDYAYIDNDGYTETGAGPLNLIVSDSDTDELIVGIDGKLSHILAQDWEFTANLGLGLDLLADEDSVTAAYAGAPGLAFSTHGTDPSSWLGRGGLGLVYGQADSLQIALSYDLEVRDDYTNQGLSLKLNMPF